MRKILRVFLSIKFLVADTIFKKLKIKNSKKILKQTNDEYNPLVINRIEVFYKNFSKEKNYFGIKNHKYEYIYLYKILDINNVCIYIKKERNYYNKYSNRLLVYLFKSFYIVSSFSMFFGKKRKYYSFQKKYIQENTLIDSIFPELILNLNMGSHNHRILKECRILGCFSDKGEK